jgi:DNA-binding transcriptional MerR regulator
MEVMMETGLTIQQVSDKTGLSAHTIRYYERIGLISPVNRAANGHRRYSEHDLGWLDFLKCLRGTGMPISEMQRYVDLQRQGDFTIPDRVQLLKLHRRRIQAQIQDLNELLKRVEGKIGFYEELEDQRTQEELNSEVVAA